uniref:Uncharacterized protein n=1 Tax=Oryza sativa subsp. japonica TaxID=39947 RepID=Q6ZF08_ORYSJ|nr:hypothetical protein [Oryza sativa Japonica Group]
MAGVLAWPPRRRRRRRRRQEVREEGDVEETNGVVGGQLLFLSTTLSHKNSGSFIDSIQPDQAPPPPSRHQFLR